MEITLVDEADLQVRIIDYVVQMSLIKDNNIQQSASFPLNNTNYDPLPSLFISPNHANYTTVSIIHNYNQVMFDIDLFLNDLTPQTLLDNLYRHYFIALGIPKRIKVGSHSVLKAELIKDTFSQLGIQMLKPEI